MIVELTRDFGEPTQREANVNGWMAVKLWMMGGRCCLYGLWGLRTSALVGIHEGKIVHADVTSIIILCRGKLTNVRTYFCSY